ncbi:hypothetical protein AM493_02275 [Flavobacterium akiainvivens]|uniref:Fibronectin type-III domain-containing protein n=1 Tax=Flavobacterium akiainvivens TaxID=1202724 RepID=A0A0M8M8Y7_9FLAO|nr:T9SS type A sorting domain-containing protein [Flavobacterium akiainvivens]KOS04995.1 hypothetical protein AM493_02275 [Flavobacterium akiainvivens]SFQ40754.1 Por secretion system C-terminal sorting domain-containing protein [Flavobacterium akiainvivens]
MKKKLLTGAFLLTALFAAKAQDSCADALEITASGSFTVDAINGTYIGTCLTGAATATEWYKITPTENSLIRVNTNLPANVTAQADTRFSIATGTCAANGLTCVDGMDDISSSNFLGDLTFQAVAGDTYFIMFDNRWLSTGFDFEITITPASCFTPSGFAFSAEGGLTTTSASIEWDEPATAPVGYEFEYGPAGFTQGSGTTLNLDTPIADIEGLTSGTNYAFYVRTDCGEGDFSEWLGPITFTTLFDPANLNYYYGFETTNLDGWTTNIVAGSPWAIENADSLEGFTAQEGENAIGAGAYTTSDSWLFSRGINVEAGQVVNISYYVAKLTGAGTGGENNIGLTRGNDTTVAGQTVITEQTIVDSADWTQRTATFTAATAGVYYLGFHYTSTGQAAANYGYALIDNVAITSPTGGVAGFNTASFLVSPNPANNFVTVSNTDNVLINNIQLTDLNGRIVKTMSFDGVAQAQVGVSDLANGVYMMNISSDKGSVTKKIVKN